MAVDAIETVLCWSVKGDLAVVEFFRNDDHYVFATTPKTLRKSLLLVGQCAKNPELSLTWDDAAQITKSLRQLVPEPLPTEPKDSWLSWVIFVGYAIIGWLFLDPVN